MIGFWTCPPDLRDKLAGWDGLDERAREAAGKDLRLLGSVLAR